MTDEDSDESDGRTATVGGEGTTAETGDGASAETGDGATSEPADIDVTDDADRSAEPVGDGGFAESTDGPTAEADDAPLLKPSLRQFPWLRAAGAAVATIAVEYVVVALAFVAGPSSMDSSAFDSLAGELLQYAFVLYNAHHVPIITTATNAAVAGSRMTNALYGAEGGSIPPAAFFALPIVALLVSGAVFELRRRGGRASSTLEESALVGTGIAAGYAVVGTGASLVLVRRITFEGGNASSGPAILWALVATVCFPLVFATIGAAVAAVYDERSA
ncbi:hypothetical protein [Halomicrobium urmianum]|uniref:hypothetical protein n=1 Tax=Halomicrobium urmianum TaxID=1586233 RepID=UPI001CD93864|nr:hypothetical protein [Halomicrobium urmianum]